MKIQSIYYDNIGVARIILESDSGNEYDIAIDNPRRIAWCSCPFYVFNKIPCKHILFAMNYLEYDKMVDRTKSLKHLTTGCKTIDNLLGGGIPYGIVTAVFGEPTTGKTLFGYQSGLSNLANSNKDTILIETEGLRDIDTYNILEKFKSRWNLSSADITKRFKIIHTLGDPKLQSIQKLFQMFGYMITLEISKNGKYSIQFQNTIPTLTPNQLEKTSMIILDSLTKPVKDSVGSETQNLPARAQMTERLFGKLYHIAKVYNIAILVINHASVNPAVPYGRDLGKPYGGSPVLYNSKYAIGFVDATSEIKKNTGWGIEARRVRLLRRPDEQTTGQLYPVRLKKDWGFDDS